MSIPDSWPLAELHARWAEELGFSSLWTADHLRDPRDAEAGLLDGWSLLAAWAVVTKGVTIGSLVSNLIYRHPALLARQAATTDVIAGGRHVLGIGTGVYETDHAMAGVPPWPASERVARLDSCLGIVDRLLRGETVSTGGPYYVMHDAVVRPRPVCQPRPPLLVGAIGPRTIRVAVRHADIWNTFGGFAATEADALAAIRNQCAHVEQACIELGRDPATLKRSILLYRPFDPFAESHALERLLDIFQPLDIDELIVYAPPPDRESLLIRALESIANG